MRGKKREAAPGAEPPSSHHAGQRADVEGEGAASCQQEVQEGTPGSDAQESQSGGAVAEEVQSLKAAIAELQVCLLVLVYCSTAVNALGCCACNCPRYPRPAMTASTCRGARLAPA